MLINLTKLEKNIRDFKIVITDLDLSLDKKLEIYNNYNSGFALCNVHFPFFLTGKNLDEYTNDISFLDCDWELYTINRSKITEGNESFDITKKELEEDYVLIILKDKLEVENMYLKFEDIYFNSFEEDEPCDEPFEMSAFFTHDIEKTGETYDKKILDKYINKNIISKEGYNVRCTPEYPFEDSILDNINKPKEDEIKTFLKNIGLEEKEEKPNIFKI